VSFGHDKVAPAAHLIFHCFERKTVELPRALTPWAAYLQLFPRELVLALGPMVRRLDSVIGPLRAQGRRGDGDPDGFDGLARRGSYERLLLSEWLLAEEVPEEFVRRAAMREHGFLHLARREPVGSRVSVALFDAGPNQIGAPRPRRRARVSSGACCNSPTRLSIRLLLPAVCRRCSMRAVFGKRRQPMSLPGGNT
jgi:hypothetical protein